MVKDMKEKLKESLTSVPYINGTTDHWHEPDNERDFMSVTIHYVDPRSLKLTNRIIGTFAVDDRSGFATEKCFSDKLGEYGLRHKLRIVVSDNASAMIKAFENEEWIGCSAHNLNLVQQWAFNQRSKKEDPDPVRSVTLLFETIKSIVNTVKHNGMNQTLTT